MFKRCLKCNKRRNITLFSRDKCNKDKLRSYCKKCDEVYRKANINKIRLYRKVNKKYLRSLARKWARSLRGRFLSGKKQAKARKIGWTLSFKLYKQLLLNVCFYCEGKLNETGAGLDRVNNNLGYLDIMQIM